MSRPRFVLGLLGLLACMLGTTPAGGGSWMRPLQEVLDVLHAPELPHTRLSPTGDVLVLATPLRYPPIADLAEPMLPLAGVRIDPRTNGRHAEFHYIGLTLKRLSTGSEQPIELPADARVSRFEFSADGARFCFLNQGSDRIELWVGDTATGKARRVPDLKINPVLGWERTWMPDQKTLLVKMVPSGRGAPPVKPRTPDGPRIEESSGQSATSTYEARDVLTGPYDEALFEHYALSQLATVDAESGRVSPLGDPDIYAGVVPSPDGRLILVQRIRKPWSYLLAWYRFPQDVEIWNRDGKVVHVAARLPLADQVPIHGVPLGPRDHEWRSTEPATLVWLEALDGGNPAQKADSRDRMMTQRSPFSDSPRELYRAPHRVVGWWWGERDGLLVIQEYERERRWRHVSALMADAPEPAARKLFDLSVNDRYNDPGYPVQRTRPDGIAVLMRDGDALFFTGSGGSPEGDRPFLDRFDLTSLQRERIFRSDSSGYERFIDWIDLEEGSFLTRRESPTEVPNYVLRTLRGRLAVAAGPGEAQWETQARPVTHFQDPTPQLRQISKRIVTYERADGTPLSFTLYLPPGYQEGTALPTVVDAYPLEYSDPETAGQVSGTDRRFTRLDGTSSLFFLLGGYAVLEDVTMPVIGDPETAYDTLIEQLVADAEAAIDKAVELGVTDRARVGIMGHSHGGLMTATLLAHSDLFQAGIARSGAYNHTLRPFGFQSERRTLWQATDTYIRLSPLMHADAINEPLLLIHGEVDQNPGTVPLQSEKLYEAVRGTGGTVRLIMLPHEGHGYQSRESVEHVLAEQFAWFDRYVKNRTSTEGK